MIRPHPIILTCLVLFLVSCVPEKQETPTKGRLHILIAESAAPPIIAEVDEFMRLYRSAGAELTYSVVSSAYANDFFVRDTTRLIFTTQALLPREQELVRNSFGSLVEIVVAFDGIAAVVHSDNPVEQITTTEIGNILRGTFTRWDQLARARKMKGSIRLYLQDSSDISSYLAQRLLTDRSFTRKRIRTTSSLQTLRAISGDRFSLGFVGIGWIDSLKVPAKALEVASTEEPSDTTFQVPTEAKEKFFRPHPAHIYRNYYPLKRRVIMYVKSAPGDITAGFGTFVATTEGQQIFLQRGFVPGTQIIRLKGSY